MLQLDVVRAATASAASERTGGSRRRHFLFLQRLFFPPGVFSHHVGADPVQRDPERSEGPVSSHNGCQIKKKQFIAAVLLRVKLWICPRVM